MEVQFQIVGDYAQILRERLRVRGYEECSIDSIKDDYSLVLAYFSAMRRMVPMVQRTVYKPEGFVCPQKYKDVVAEIERKIERGENLNPYLSRQLPNLNANDALLNDWGIQHLHLGSRVITKEGKTKGMMEGTPEILYVYIDEQASYFIVIGDHNSFGDKDLLQVLQDNWPEVLEKYREPRIKSVIPGDLTSKQRDQLRRAGYNTGPVVLRDGSAYMLIGGAITYSGHNLFDAQGTDRLHNWAHVQTANVQRLVPEIAADLKARHGKEITEPVVLRLIVEGRSDSRWFLIGENGHVTIGLGNPWKDNTPMIYYSFDVPSDTSGCG